MPTCRSLLLSWFEGRESDPFFPFFFFLSFFFDAQFSIEELPPISLKSEKN